MRTKNYYYISKENLEVLIRKDNFLNEKSILVQVFSSILDKNILENVLKVILEILPQAKVIGTTTDGEILDNIVSTDKIIISITSFEHATLKVGMSVNNDDSFSCGKNLAQKLLCENTKILFLFSDGLQTNGEVFLKGVKSLSSEVVLAGGMAGDGAVFDTTYIFSNEGILSWGAVGVSVNSESLHVRNTYSFNWQEIGKVLTITKVKDNRVYEIDGISAVAMYAKYLGDEIADSLPAVGIEFPLIISRNGVKIARAVLGKEKDGSLIFAGNLHEGDQVHFGYGNADMILKDSIQLKNNFEVGSVESIFIYSCMARRRFLEDAISEELTPLAQIAPSVGFFTYGEFFNAEQCELLNQTMTVIAMSEGINKKGYIFSDKINTKRRENASTTHKALSHLIQATSKELRETNENLEKIVKAKTKDLEDKIKELENASKVKSDFLAGMSHEIRTPLNAILGFVDILRRGEKDKERQKRFSIIKNSGNTLLTIINDILDFSKIESGKMFLERRKFATKKPFKEIGHLFYEKSIESGIELKLHFDDNLPRFFVGDIVRIKQIVANFLSNAIKFTPRGGEILMSLYFDDEKKTLKLSVKDTGIGINEKNRKKIFESFTQEDSSTTRKFGGTGLGLSISTALVESMDGSITLESEIGKGSTFSCVLPLLESEKSDLDDFNHLEKIHLEKSLKGIKILLVEDNKTNQMLMKILLTDIDIEVTLAENGVEAVETFKKHTYDLILMDENMPRMNGIEATKIILAIEVEKKLKHTPIIALTANALATDRARFLDAGMDEFVSKPIDHDKFIRVLHSFLL